MGLPSVADWKNDHGVQIDLGGKDSKASFKEQFAIFKCQMYGFLGLAAAATYVTRYAINSWGILYLQEAKGYSLIEAGSMLGVTTIAGIIGCVAYGFVSDKFFPCQKTSSHINIWFN